MLHAIARSVPDAVAVTTYPEARVIYCNSGYETLLGVSQQQIVGRSVSEIGIWVHKDQQREYARRLKTEGSVSNLEVEFRGGDGAIGSFLLSGTRLAIHAKEYVLTTSRDISSIKRTERELLAAREELKGRVDALQASEERLREEARVREEVEKRLRQSEAMFRTVFDTSIDIIGINSTVDGRFIAMNRTLLEFTGLSREEMLGQTALELDMWESRARASEYFKLLRRDGSVHGFEANLRRWDGTLVPHITSAIVVDIEGEPCIVAIAHDISILKRSEAEILAAREELSRQLETIRDSEHRFQQSEAVLRKIFDASPNSTSLIRMSDGKHLVTNQATERMYGYSLEEIRRINNPELKLWVDEDKRQEFLRRLWEEGRVRDMEVRVRSKDGRILIAELSSEVVEIGGEKCVVAIAADITTRKRIEAELVGAREEALAASEAKSNFLSSMSHEIRTPMNAMLGMADLLWETTLTLEQRRFLDSIRSNGNALMNLINGILDLAKVESGRLSLEWIAFDPRELVERVAETFGVKAHEKQLELAVRIAPEVPAELIGDPLRLRQILMNLVGNAIKFTEHGEIVLDVRCSSGTSSASHANGLNGNGVSEPRHQSLHFEVLDSGIGIAPVHIDKIFATFTQADSSTARKYGGSGLGLSIVKRLVELMGGTLNVESEPGRGSVFSFVIPFQLAANNDSVTIPANLSLAPQAADGPKPSVHPVLAPLDGRRVLVVDDAAINRTILREMLESHGARVEEAVTGEQALAMVAEALQCADPFTLVLLDGRMPGLDGVETARRLLREDERTFKCCAVILMITSDALNPTLARCRQLAMKGKRSFAYIVKPIRMSDLAEAINQVLSATIEPAPAPEMRDERPMTSIRPEVLVNGSTHDSLANGLTNGVAAHAAALNGRAKPLKILLAEDSPDNRMLMEAYFKGSNYQLEMVENGELAVERFKSGAYDAVLMDIHMPVMDGYEATRQIREWENSHSADPTPIIALTASAQDEAVRESLAAGCSRHLSKPIRRAVLLQVMQEITSCKNSTSRIDSAKCPANHKNGGVKVGRNVVQIDADLSDLVPGFLAHKRDDARTIAAAIEHEDYETLSKLGHKMKGEGGSYGFDVITDIGAAIEQAAKARDRTAARRWATELADYLESLEVVYT
jgi:PAS domain S-box-containing protein